MFWTNLAKFLSFTGVKDETVWQDVFISAFLIPIGLLILNKLLNWWNSIKPAQLLFKNSLNKNIYIFHSQMSGADSNYNFNPNQKYITRFPEPLPSNHANLGIQKKLNIDPILSQAEAECLTDIYNVLGRIGKMKNIFVGDLINDWKIWSAPIFSVGFNPKTFKLIEKCKPIYFELLGGVIKIKDSNITYDSNLPNDAGIIQKTFIRDNNNPIFIIAGLGTMGTSASGFIFSQNFIDIGKLYGSGSFCIFLKVKTNEGRNSAFIDKMFPIPNWRRIILHPLTYFRYKNKNIFQIK